MSPVPLLLCAVCVSATQALLAGQVYKWVDENGVTVFSQTAPANTPSEVISEPPPPDGTEAARAELEARIDRLDKAEEARHEAAAEAGAEARRASAAAEACERSRAHLASLESGPPQKLVVAPDGTSRRLSYEELQERIAKTRKDVKDHCNGL